jgi:hypothetical protein
LTRHQDDDIVVARSRSEWIVKSRQLPVALASRLGPDAAVALEDALEAREVQMTQALRMEMQELRTEVRVGMQELRGEMQALRADLKSMVSESRAELKTIVADTRADLMKWSLLFWVGQVAVVLALARLFTAYGP